MIKRLLLVIALGVTVSGCFVAPLALIGPATSGFTTASIIQSGATTGVTGEIIDVLTGAQTAANSNTLYIKYTGSGTSKTSKVFNASEGLTFAGGSNTTYTNATVLSSANTPTGNGVYFALSDAIVYAKGQFIRHANAGIVVGRYNQIPSKIVGFKVNESIVTSNTDTTLLDQAQGAYNYTATGANRIKLETEILT